MRAIKFDVMITIPTGYGWRDVKMVRFETYEGAEKFIKEDIDNNANVSEMGDCFQDLWIRKVFVWVPN